MQTLSEIPELVTCFLCNPKPRPQHGGKSTSHAPRQLVMELMEARLRSPASADWSAHCVLQSVTGASVETIEAWNTAHLCSEFHSVSSSPHPVGREHLCCRLMILVEMLHAGW